MIGLLAYITAIIIIIVGISCAVHEGLCSIKNTYYALAVFAGLHRNKSPCCAAYVCVGLLSISLSTILWMVTFSYSELPRSEFNQ